jgi:hypothetical protein
VPFPGESHAEVAQLKEAGKFREVREIDARLPRSVDTILLKLLAHLPDNRFQTASQLIDVLLTSRLTDEDQTPVPLGETTAEPAATRPEIRLPKKKKAAGPVWIYQYKHEGGVKRGRARTQDLVQMYQEGILPADFFVARPGEQTCRHFNTFPEFTQLERRPDRVVPSTRKSRKGIWIALIIAATALLTAGASVLLNMLF